MKLMNSIFLVLFCIGLTSTIMGMKKPLPSSPPIKNFINETFLGNKEQVKNFLSKNINPNFFEDYNDLPELLKEKINPIIGGLNAFSTAILQYAELNNSDNKSLVEIFLNSNKVNINAQSNTGFTALMIATMLNGIDAAKLLLEQGANPNVQNTDGNTALHFAAFAEYKDITELLIQHGAQIDIANNNDETPQYIAISKHNEELEKIFETTEKLIVLVQSAYKGESIQKEHFATDIDVNGYINPQLINAKETNQDINALSAAAINGHSITVSQLINTYHANINSQNKEGLTALMLIPISAANVTDENLQHNLFQTFQLLLENHADIEKRTVDQETVIYAVLMMPFNVGKQYVEELLKYKPNLTVKDKDNQTPLEFAQSSENGKKYIDILKNAEKSGIPLSDNNLIKNLSNLTNNLTILGTTLR